MALSREIMDAINEAGCVSCSLAKDFDRAFFIAHHSPAGATHHVDNAIRHMNRLNELIAQIKALRASQPLEGEQAAMVLEAQE